MYLTILFVVGVLGHVSNGVPLESPTSDFGQFFEERIVGGNEATHGGYPYMVSLVTGHTWQSLVCGGSIITHRHIITAAHCITGFIQWGDELSQTFYAMVGSNEWHKGTKVELEDFAIHPKYDQFLIKADVGLLYTRYKIQMNDRVATIKLHRGFVDGDVKSYVTGWGTEWLWGNVPNWLQYLPVRTVSHEQCVRDIQMGSSQTGIWAPPIDRELEICTIHSPGHGLCHGDSGSGLVIKGLFELTGVVSWGVPCALGWPDVHARLFGGNLFFVEDTVAFHSRRDGEQYII